MKHKEDIDLINKLFEISKNLPDRYDNDIYDKLGYRFWDFDSFNISFTGEDMKLCDKLMSALFYKNKEIYNTCDIKNFELRVITLMSVLISEKRKCTTADIEKLHANILSIPILDCEIFYNFYGAQTIEASVQFGEFEVYDFEKSHDALKQKYTYLVNEEYYFDRRDSDHVIGIKVKAREQNKALEKSTELAKTFENVFNYMIGDLKQRELVSIFNYKELRSTKIVVCYKDASGSSVKNNTQKPVRIEDPFFKDPKQGNDKLWNLITKENKSKIEERILKSVEWIGKAVIEEDPSKSLVMFVFAIESMLQFNSGALINASIVSQLSDSLAFIINDDPSERKRIANKFKEIYGKRSAIAHGADKVIELEDLKYARDIAKLMIISLLTEKPFCDFKTMENLTEYITDLKFK